MEITEEKFQELLKTGEYPIALDYLHLNAGRYQIYGAPRPNAPRLIVITRLNGRRSIRQAE